MLLVLPFVFIPFIINFPVGLMIYWVTTNLWTVGQGLVTRRLYPRPVLELPKKSSRTPAKQPAGTQTDREVQDGPRRRSRRSAAGDVGRPRSAEAGQASQEEGPAHAAMSETDTPEQGETIADREAEAAGETVGEAKWTALRDLERRLPGARQVPGRVRRAVGGRARLCWVSASSRRR